MGKSALLVIDVQMEFARRSAAGQPRSNPNAEDRIADMIALFRTRGLPVVHVHHDDPNPASGFRLAVPTGQPMPCAAPAPEEAVFVKHGSSGFIGTGLDQHLRSAGVDRLVIVGAAVNYCVASTVRMARNLGYKAVVVSDAVFGFGVTGHDGRAHDPDTVLSVSLGTLGEGFAQVLPGAAIPALLEAG